MIKEVQRNVYCILFWAMIPLLILSLMLVCYYRCSLNGYKEISLGGDTVDSSRIYVYNRTMIIPFETSDGSEKEWNVPFDSLEFEIQKGQYRRNFMPEVFIPMTDLVYNSYTAICSVYDCEGADEEYGAAVSKFEEDSLQYLEIDLENGSSFVMDFRQFVDSGSFYDVVGSLYEDSDSDYEFIYEVWNVVAQLTTYSTEINDTPRYPLETLLAGGGDCEDSAILFVSMLKAAPVDWNIEFVYTDLDNLDNPKNVNHVLVFVNTGTGEYFIETTNKENMQPYESVEGWRVAV